MVYSDGATIEDIDSDELLPTRVDASNAQKISGASGAAMKTHSHLWWKLIREMAITLDNLAVKISASL